MSNQPSLLIVNETGDDRVVIRKILAGEVDAFEVLLRKYSARVFAMVGRKVPPDDVEAVAQDVFLSAFRSLATYESIQPFEHWLARITRRRCCDFWRQRDRRGRLELCSVGTLDDVQRERESKQQETVMEEAAERVGQALRTLEAEDRTLIEGIYFEEISLKEMAATMGWSLVKTKVRAHRARRKLKMILEGGNIRGEVKP